MNYRHIYHAGNFADVFKHVVLVALLKSLQRKEKSFCFIDTHAGIGRYLLSSEEATKTQEYKQGVDLIVQQNPEAMPEIIQNYLAVVKSYYPFAYPGSPLIAQHFLRAHDRMVLSELHPVDVQILKNEMYFDKRIAVHHVDAYLAMKAFLPPKEHRGLVLIDPAYEEVNEMKKVITALQKALKHWRQGIYAVWYPIKAKYPGNQIRQQLEALEVQNRHFVELTVLEKQSSEGLIGCGMMVINPPWGLDTTLQKSIPWLWKTLSPEGKGYYQWA